MQEPHFHVWLRSGRVFTMTTRPFANRSVAHKWAVVEGATLAGLLLYLPGPGPRRT